MVVDSRKKIEKTYDNLLHIENPEKYDLYLNVKYISYAVFSYETLDLIYIGMFNNVVIRDMNENIVYYLIKK